MSGRAGSERRRDKGTVVFHATVEISELALYHAARDEVDTLIAIEVEAAAQGLYAEIQKWAK